MLAFVCVSKIHHEINLNFVRQAMKTLQFLQITADPDAPVSLDTADNRIEYPNHILIIPKERFQVYSYKKTYKNAKKCRKDLPIWQKFCNFALAKMKRAPALWADMHFLLRARVLCTLHLQK